MKKRLLALCLTLALCLGLLVIPAGAITCSDAETYLQKVKSHRGSSYLVDFDGDGREELVLANNSSSAFVAEIWQGDVKLGETRMDPGLMGYGHLYFGGKNGKVYLGSFCGEIRGSWEEYCVYTLEKGKWVEKKRGSRDPYSYEWSMTLDYSSKTTARKQLEAELKALEATMPKVPNVPAAPLGSGLTPAPSDAIAALKDISYYGDRSAITMTQEQAGALLNQISWYSSITTNPNYPGTGPANTYAALFDAGAGVPGLFMAKGYCMAGGSPYVSGAQVITDFGESALWTFQKGKLTLFSPATYGANYTLYPACVEQDNGAPDGSYTELRYFPMNYGSLSNTPSTTVITTETTASVNGYSVSQSKANEHMKAWRGTGARAHAGQGGGVEYVINGMTPAADMTAALKSFVAALTPAPAPVNLAYPSTQIVNVDGKAVEFQCYALKDAAGNDINYIKLRDLANILDGSAAQFEVSWDGAVNIETGKPYTPNGSEMSTPFSGQQEYQSAAAKTMVNGEAKDLAVFTLTDDHGGAYTYYKLRDLGAAIGFKVDWSAEQGIFIETK